MDMCPKCKMHTSIFVSKNKHKISQWFIYSSHNIFYVCAQSLGCVWLFMTPWTVGCQAPLSVGFLRQEYWSRWPFPTPRHLPDLGIEPLSPSPPTYAGGVGSLPLCPPPGKPKNTGVGSLSLLQQIFPTQELNWDLLHCRWILYQLSYEENILEREHI